MSDAPEFLPHGSVEAVPDVVDVLLRDNTDLTIASTAAETTLFTFPVPAYMLDGDRGIRVTIWADRFNNTGGNVATIIRVYYGATVLWRESVTNGTATLHGPVNMNLELCAKNSDAIQELMGIITLGGTGSAPTTGEGTLLTVMMDGVIYGESTEDATTALDFKVTVEMDTSSANATWIHRKSLVEHM